MLTIPPTARVLRAVTAVGMIQRAICRELALAWPVETQEAFSEQLASERQLAFMQQQSKIRFFRGLFDRVPLHTATGAEDTLGSDQQVNLGPPHIFIESRDV